MNTVLHFKIAIKKTLNFLGIDLPSRKFNETAATDQLPVKREIGENFPATIALIDGSIGDRERYASQLTHLYQLADPSYRSSYNASVVRVVQAMLEQLESPTKLAPIVMDFGCWSGATTRYISDELEIGCVGAEIDAKCLEFARAYLETRRVAFIDVNFERINCDDASFDMVLANAVFANMFPTQHEPMVKELVRVTKPGGIILIIDSNNPASEEVQQRLRGLYRLLEGDNGSYLGARRSFIDGLKPATAPNQKAALETCYCSKDDIAEYLAGRRSPSLFDPDSLRAPYALTAPFAAPSTLTDPKLYAEVLRNAGLTVTVSPGYPSDVPVTTESSFVLIAKKPRNVQQAA